MGAGPGTLWSRDTLDDLFSLLFHQPPQRPKRQVVLLWPVKPPPEARPRMCPPASGCFLFCQAGPSWKQVQTGLREGPSPPPLLAWREGTPFYSLFLCVSFKQFITHSFGKSGSGLLFFKIVGGFASLLIVFVWRGFVCAGCVTHVRAEWFHIQKPA